MAEDERKIVLDKSNFSEWYNDVVDVAGLSEKRYPIKGMNVWTPYGWKIMQKVDSIIRRECDATGHDEVHFPLLIPKTEFQKEADHIKGFDADFKRGLAAASRGAAYGIAQMKHGREINAALTEMDTHARGNVTGKAKKMGEVVDNLRQREAGIHGKL